MLRNFKSGSTGSAGGAISRALEAGELAAQFDMDTSRLSWGAIERVATYAVTDQPMVVGKIGRAHV